MIPATNPIATKTQHKNKPTLYTRTVRAMAMAGSEIVALLSRQGNGAPYLDAEGKVHLAPGNHQVDDNLLKATGRSRELLRSQVAAYLEVTREGMDDQAFVMSLIDTMISERKAGIIVPEDDRLLFVHGSGGVGKTQVVAMAVKKAIEAQIGVVTVVAPTNRAVKVLAKRIKAIAGDHPLIRIGTCHSVFRTLTLNTLGEGVVEHFLAGEKGPLVLPLADPETLADVNDNYERFVASAKHYKKALAVAAQLRDMADPSIGHFAILKHMGFKELDTRVTCWVDNIGQAALVIVDEMSMVPRSIVYAALMGGSHVIATGDAAQLEPVSLEFSDANGSVLLDKPAIHLANSRNSVYLWKSRRTAQDSGIKILSDYALKAPSLKAFVDYAKQIAANDKYPDVKNYPNVERIPKEDLEAGPVLTYTNQTRHTFNKSIRKKLGYPENRIVPGDRFFVSAINPHARSIADLVKDEFVTLVDVESNIGDNDFTSFTFKDEVDRTISVEAIALIDKQAKSENCIEYFNTLAGDGSGNISVPEDTYYASPRELILCPAFSLTIHKSQGSEWPVVSFNLRSLTNLSFLTEEDDGTPGLGGIKWRRWRRLAYTACSRAREKLIVIV